MLHITVTAIELPLYVITEKYMVVIASTYKVPYSPDPTILTGEDLMSLEAFLPPGDNSMTLSAVRYVCVMTVVQVTEKMEVAIFA